jgi:uncharacterized protein
MPRSSRSFLFPDVNVWMALTYEGHVHHATARKWFEGLGAEAHVCFCRFTQLSLLRLLTTTAVMGDDEVMSQADAWRAYDRWMKDGRIVLIEEPRAIEPAFRSMTRKPRPAPKDWADSYLGAFAVTGGLRLVTFDQAFRGKIRDLLVLTH